MLQHVLSIEGLGIALSDETQKTLEVGRDLRNASLGIDGIEAHDRLGRIGRPTRRKAEFPVQSLVIR